MKNPGVALGPGAAGGAAAGEDGRRRHRGGSRPRAKEDAAQVPLPGGAAGVGGEGRQGRAGAGGGRGGGEGGVTSSTPCQGSSPGASPFIGHEQALVTDAGGVPALFDPDDADSGRSTQGGRSSQSSRPNSQLSSPSSFRRRRPKAADSDSRSPLGLKRSSAKSHGVNGGADKENRSGSGVEEDRADRAPFWTEQLRLAKALLERSGFPASRRVFVVAFFGRSRVGAKRWSPSISNQLKGSCAIGENGTVSESWRLVAGDTEEEGIYMCVDKAKSVIYLDLRAGWDGDMMAEHMRDASRSQNSEKIYEWLSAQQHFANLASLFIFLMSHVVIISHPSAGDSAAISQLHLLAVAKQQLAGYAADFVRRCWVKWAIDPPANATLVPPNLRERMGGRVFMRSEPSGGALVPGMCVPVLCFEFQEVSIPELVGGKAGEADACCRIQTSLQNRLRFLLRPFKKAADPNLPFDNRQLFVLPPVLPPPNVLPFVQLIPRGMEVPLSRMMGNTPPTSEEQHYTDPVTAMLAVHDTGASAEKLFSSLRAKGTPDAAFSTDAASLSSGRNGGRGCTDHLIAVQLKAGEAADSPHSKIHALKDTVSALAEAFRSIGEPHASFSGPNRSSAASRSAYAASQSRSVALARSMPHVGADDELPSAEAWTAAAVALRLFLFKPSDGDVPVLTDLFADMLDCKAADAAEGAAKRLQSLWKADVALSDSHCRQCMRKALDAYLLDLPRIYTRKYHQEKLDRAVALYKLTARGSCFGDYLAHLESSCTVIWEQERRRCENVSLTGHKCARPFGHDKIPAEGAFEESEGPDTAAKAVDTNVADTARAPPAQCQSSFLAMHACNCGRSKAQRTDPFTLLEANCEFYDQFECCKPGQSTETPVPPPPFPGCAYVRPMWSVLRVGPASVYRSAAGLAQKDGFVPGGFLSALNGDRPSRVRCRSRRGGPPGRPLAQADDGEKKRHSTDAYVGIEYECPLGHRFFGRRTMALREGQDPNKPMPPEDGYALIKSDHPIYMPCLCDGTRSAPAGSVTAQLQRIMVVVPGGRWRVQLQPTVLVRLCSDDNSSAEERAVTPGDRFELPPNSFIVMRLPYVYYDEDGRPLPRATGKEPHSVRQFKLLREFVTIEATERELADI